MEPELREISLKDSDTDTSHLVQNPSNADDTSQGEDITTGNKRTWPDFSLCVDKINQGSVIDRDVRISEFTPQMWKCC